MRTAFRATFVKYISQDDIDTLNGNGLLNDMIVNRYLELIAERSLRFSNFPRCFVLPNYFIMALEGQGVAAASRWTRRIDIFANDLLMIPVNISNVHWVLTVIDFRKQTCTFFDSKQQPNKKLLDSLMRYLENEAVVKGRLFNSGEWTLIQGTSPIQNNGTDCGVFVCETAERISRDQPLNYGERHAQLVRGVMKMELENGRIYTRF